MPRKRTSRKRKRSYKKKGTSLAKKVSYLMRQNKINRPQLTFYDTVGSGVDIFTTPGVIKILSASDNGARLTLKSVQLKANLKLMEEFASTAWYRIVIFTDRSNEDGRAPQWGEVYKNDVGGGAIRSIK